MRCASCTPSSPALPTPTPPTCTGHGAAATKPTPATTTTQRRRLRHHSRGLPGCLPGLRPDRPRSDRSCSSSYRDYRNTAAWMTWRCGHGRVFANAALTFLPPSRQHRQLRIRGGQPRSRRIVAGRGGSRSRAFPSSSSATRPRSHTVSPDGERRHPPAPPRGRRAPPSAPAAAPPHTPNPVSLHKRPRWCRGWPLPRSG